MKKYGLIILTVACVFAFSACSLDESEPIEKTPDLARIRTMCDLATYDVHFHNVAKETKPAQSGFFHIGEKDREFWIEYSGSVKVGIDMSECEMKVEESVLTIYLPEAKLLGTIKVDENSFKETITARDSFNSNPVKAEDTSKALKDAQEEITKMIENDSSTLEQARERAKILIKKYIEQFNESVGTEYTVEFADEPFKAE